MAVARMARRRTLALRVFGRARTKDTRLGLKDLPRCSVTTATSVRVRDGKRIVTDGPFAETREQLGGYFLVEAGDLNEAIAIASRIPGARKGTVEVRPVMEIAGLPKKRETAAAVV